MLGVSTAPSSELFQDLAALDISVKSFVLSNDEKTAFICQKNGLVIADISIPDLPIILNSYNLPDTIQCMPAISPNDEFLILRRSGETHLIRVKSPKFPEFLFKGILITSNEMFALSQPSIVFSSDSKMIYLALGDKIGFINITDPTVPISWSIDLPDMILSVLTISKDDKTLFLSGSHTLFLDISDLENLQVITIYPVTPNTIVASIALNDDMLYIANRDNLGLPWRDVIIGMNVSNIRDPTVENIIRVSQTEQSQYCKPTMMIPYASTAGKSLLIASCARLYQLNLVAGKFNEIGRSGSLGWGYKFALSRDRRTIYQGTENQFVIQKLYFDVESNEVFDAELDVIGSLEGMGIYSSVVLAPDGKSLYMANYEKSLGLTRIYIADISNYSAPVFAPNYFYSLKTNVDYRSLDISNDGKYIYSILKNDTIYLTNVSNTKEIKNDYWIPIRNLDEFILSPNKKMVYAITGNFTSLEFWDISDIWTPEKVQTMALPEGGSRALTTWRMSPDGKLLFYRVKDIYIISLDLQQYGVISKIEVTDLARQQFKYVFTYSPERGALFALWQGGLAIFDVSNLKSPKLIGSSSSLATITSFSNIAPALITPGGDYLIIRAMSGIIVMDIKNLAEPTISKFYAMETDYHSCPMVLSPDGNTLIFHSNSSGNAMSVKLVNFRPKYILEQPTERFEVGNVYSKKFFLLQKEQDSPKYNAYLDSYKVFRLSRQIIETSYLTTQIEVKYSLLPSWMSFDVETQALYVEPRLQSHVGSYFVYAFISPKISWRNFTELGNIIKDETEAKNLMAYLLSQGYIDSQGFLTGNFDANEELMLSSQYIEIEKEIRGILAKNIIQVRSQIKVYSSLNLLNSTFFKIRTLSYNPVDFSIKLDRSNSMCRFPNKAYSAVKESIADNNKHITLTGSLLDVNNALENLVIDYQNTSSICSGWVYISDGLNPRFERYVSTDLSVYLRKNQEPFENENLQLQSQINDVPVRTGEFFTISLDSRTFLDANNLKLTYKLAMQDENRNTPDWLSLTDLKLRGSPPESLFLSGVKLQMIVSNEFKSKSIPFTLKVGVSPIYALKLLALIVTNLYTWYNLWKNFDKIYNILFKKSYRYPKDFELFVGQEITDKVVFPIRFINKEIKESQIILKELKKEFSDGLAKHFIGLNENQLDKEKLVKSIQNVVERISEKNLKIYKDGDDWQLDIIHQIIINSLVSEQLNSKDEKKTKQIFEKLKKKWFELVEPEGSKFIVNDTKLDQELKNLEDISSQNTNETDSLNVKLLKKGYDFNLSLLKDALIKQAFEYQNLNIPEIGAQVELKQRIPRNWVKRFLKRDLVPLDGKVQTEIAYGIKCERSKGKLSFLGTVQKEFKDETLVVQVLNYRGRILRELWISGVKNNDIKSRLESINEQL